MKHFLLRGGRRLIGLRKLRKITTLGNFIKLTRYRKFRKI